MKKNEKLEKFLKEAIEDRTSKIAKLTVLIETEQNVSSTKDAWRKGFISDCATELKELKEILRDYWCDKVADFVSYYDDKIKTLDNQIADRVVLIETDKNLTDEEIEGLRKSVHDTSVKRKIYEAVKIMLQEESQKEE